MEIQFTHFNFHINLAEQRLLFKECFPETAGLPILTNDHYYWKFHSKIGPSKSMEFIASINGTIVGYYAAIPFYYNFNGELLKVAMVCDVMTSVKARGKGVFTKLGDYATSEISKLGIDITTGYPIRPEVLPGHLKVGWEINQEMPLYGCFVSFNSFLKKKKLVFAAPLFNFTNIIVSNFFNYIFFSKNKHLKININAPSNIESLKKIANFYSVWQQQTSISLVKDLDFLKWRLTAPSKCYDMYTLTENGNIVAVMITTQMEKEGVPCVGIIDMCIYKGYYQYSRLLLNALKKESKAKKRELILMMMSKYWYKEYKIYNSLFFKTPFKFRLIIKNLSLKFSQVDFKKENAWHPMWIDSDDL